MAEIHTVWIVQETGVRCIVANGNPNTLGLICPKGSECTDTATGKKYISEDSAASVWSEFAKV